ncbi:MAG: nuclear transport factor 2 family protein, partial [Mariniphaga sp.]|nr:nuclear transport factor 2 family protein [Mariniphaga sp.]
MKTIIFLIALCEVIVSCQPNQEKVSIQPFENEILAHEHAMWERWSAGDPTGFAESFHDDATLFRWHDVQTFARLNGKEEIQEYLHAFTGNIPAHKYEMVDPRIQIYGETAIMTFEYHIFMPESELAGRWKATDVY